MSETSTTHHKIKAEWTKASEIELHQNTSSECDKIKDPANVKVKILENIVISSQKSVKCHFCDKNFDKSVYDEHLRTHDKTFFHCTHDGCDKKFKRKSSLRKHNYLHKGKFKYECQECSLTFIDLTKFEVHKNTKHKTDDTKSYKCNLCEKSFASLEYLKRHQVFHSDEYRYKCSVCDQKFKWMTSFQIHQTIHVQKKTMVECSQCYKRFFNQRTLERHLQIHKNVKYKCMLCERVVSNRKDNIRRHIKHLHNEVARKDISSKITTVSATEKPQEEVKPTTSTKTLEDINEIPQKPSTPQAVINNRVNVIQSIGNPNKNQQIPQAKPPSPPPEEKKLPPKKKTIAIVEETSTSAAPLPTPKPKYDPIQHYRKILLGFAKDDDHPTTIEDNTEEEENEQETETQVFPVHWRKRTSQNYITNLFRR